MKKLINRLRLKNTDRGSAIIIVLVAVSFTFILISTLLYITLSNILMKYGDQRIKDNFYTAETVVEQIKAGLEDYASDAFSDMYQKSLTTYAGSDPLSMTEAYLSNLTLSLCVSGNTAQYDPKKLLGFVDKELIVADPDSTDVSRVIDGSIGDDTDCLDVKAFMDVNGGSRPHTMERTSSGLLLKNIYVKYTNPVDGTVSVIQTDFMIGIPSGSFAYTSQMPDVFDYAIIAGQHMDLTPGTNVDSYKSIYGGDKGMTIGAGDSGSLDMFDRHYLITKGTVSLNGSATGSKEGVLTTNPLTTFYARELDIDKGKADLGGTTSVSDDLIYRGAGTVTVSGDYVGFGNSFTDAEQSSALLINAKDAVFDGKKAKRVIFAGHAFVDEENGVKTDKLPALDQAGWVNDSSAYNYKFGADIPGVMMDQSLAAKADQVAYLVPPDCIGVYRGNSSSNPDEVKIGMNPLIGVERTDGTGKPDVSKIVGESIAKDGNFRLIDFDHPSYYLGGKTLASYYGNTYNGVKYEKHVAIRYVRTQYGETLAYFYVVISPERAKTYLSDWRSVDKTTLDKYFRFYDPKISMTEDAADTYMEGTYYTLIDDELTWHEASSPTNIYSRDVYLSTFLNLCAKLIESGVTDEELKKNIFDNILYSDDVAADAGSGTITYTIGSGENQVRGILTGEPVFTYNSGNDNIRLIISTGDVIVKHDFQGLIIAKGNITCDGGSIKLYSDRVGLARVLQTYRVQGGGTRDKRLLDYFRDGASFPLDGIAVGEEESGAPKKEKASSNELDYGDLVHYENYTKR